MGLSSRSSVLVLLGLLGLASAASAWSEQGVTELLDTMKQLPAASAYHIPPSTGYAQLCIIKRFLRNGLTGKSLEMPDVINEGNQAAVKLAVTFLNGLNFETVFMEKLKEQESGHRRLAGTPGSSNSHRLTERLHHENHYSSGAEGYPPKDPSYSA